MTPNKLNHKVLKIYYTLNSDISDMQINLHNSLREINNLKKNRKSMCDESFTQLKTVSTKLIHNVSEIDDLKRYIDSVIYEVYVDNGIIKNN